MKRKLSVILAILIAGIAFNFISCNHANTPELLPPPQQDEGGGSGGGTLTETLPPTPSSPVTPPSDTPSPTTPPSDTPTPTSIPPEENWALSKITFIEPTDRGETRIELTLNYDENGRIGSVSSLFADVDGDTETGAAIFTYNSNGRLENLTTELYRYIFAYREDGKIDSIIRVPFWERDNYLRVVYEYSSPDTSNTHTERLFRSADRGITWIEDTTIHADAEFSAEGWPTNYTFHTPERTLENIYEFKPGGQLKRALINEGDRTIYRFLPIYREPDSILPVESFIRDNYPSFHTHELKGTYSDGRLSEEVLKEVLVGSRRVIRTIRFEYIEREPFHHVIPIIMQLTQMYGNSLLYAGRADIHFGREGLVLPIILF